MTHPFKCFCLKYLLLLVNVCVYIYVYMYISMYGCLYILIYTCFTKIGYRHSLYKFLCSMQLQQQWQSIVFDGDPSSFGSQNVWFGHFTLTINYSFIIVLKEEKLLFCLLFSVDLLFRQNSFVCPFWTQERGSVVYISEGRKRESFSTKFPCDHRIKWVDDVTVLRLTRPEWPTVEKVRWLGGDDTSLDIGSTWVGSERVRGPWRYLND